MGRGFWRKDVLPFAAMVTVECTNVSVNILFKAAASKGLSNYVFAFYAFAFATLVLSPFAFAFHRTKVLPPLNFSILCRICLLGLMGCAGQMMVYVGISYSSPTLASAMSNLTPPFTFILAVIFRMEKINLRSWRTCAKILGTIVSISGALLVVLYKGPPILFTAPSDSLDQDQPMFMSSPQTDWIIGGLLAATTYFMYSFWYILQTEVMNMYPDEIMVVFLFNVFATIFSAPVCLIAEPNLMAWRLKTDMALLACVYAGFFGTSLTTVVHSWGLHLKGPVFVSSFKPLSIAIAAILGITFLGDALYLGSAVGVIIISVGFYAVLWGKAKEENMADARIPLLQAHKVEQI